MSIHINKFIDKLQGFEQRNQKDFIMPLQDAKNLHNDITKLLLTLQDLQQELAKQTQSVTVEMTGGKF
jgi:hypothetical protein